MRSWACGVERTVASWVGELILALLFSVFIPVYLKKVFSRNKTHSRSKSDLERTAWGGSLDSVLVAVTYVPFRYN